MFPLFGAVVGIFLIAGAFATYGGARVLLLVLGVLFLLGGFGHVGYYGYYGYGGWWGPRVIVAPYAVPYGRPYGVPYGVPARPYYRGPYRR